MRKPWEFVAQLGAETTTDAGLHARPAYSVYVVFDSDFFGLAELSSSEVPRYFTRDHNYHARRLLRTGPHLSFVIRLLLLLA